MSSTGATADRPRETPQADEFVEMLGHFARVMELPFERHACRRVLAEAMSAFPGPVEEQWWRWVIEAGRTLGLPLRVTEGELFDAVDLAATGVPAATRMADAAERWLVISQTAGAKVRFATARDASTSRWTRVETLSTKVPGLAARTPYRWVVLEEHENEHAQQHLPPFRRMLQLIRPELSDIWVVIVIAMFVGLLAIAVPVAGQQLVRTVTFGTLYQPIAILSLMLLTVLTFMGALSALQIFVVELIQRRMFVRLVADLSFRLPRVEQRAIDDEYAPELVNRFFDVLTVQKVVAGFLVDGIAVVLTTVVGMTLLAFYHPYLLGYDIALLVMMLFAIFVLGRGGTRSAINESIAKYRTAAWLQDVARCGLSFKLYGGADFSSDRADRLTGEYLQARRQHFRVLLRQVLWILGLQALASTALLGLGGYLVTQEQLSLGQLVAAELVVATIVGSFAKFAKHIEGFFDLMASIDKIGHLIDLPMEPTRGLMTLPQQGGAVVLVSDLAVGLTPSAHGHGHGHGDEHHHGHQGGHGANGHSTGGHGAHPHPVVEHVNFTVKASQAWAIVGGPGSGKTLLLETLYGLREPLAGLLTIDNVAPTDVRRDVLRRHVAMLRDVEIFPGTIAENIHLGRVDVDQEAINTALAVSGLDRELKHLQDGLETILSATGRPLSDSQCRRLMLARALAGKPRLLLVDGLLDSLTDEILSDLLPRLFDDLDSLTVIIVSGRSDIVARCHGQTVLFSGHGGGSRGSSAVASTFLH